MRLKEWYVARGPKFVYSRTANLLGRYGIGSSAAVRRIESCTATLAGLGCPPTFAVPAAILKRDPRLVHRLQDAGVEIAVHGYNHIDLRVLPVVEARDQLVRAAEAFRRSGIEVRGFRCPYLACSDELVEALPGGLFDYSSNRTICYDEMLDLNACNKGVEFDVLKRFYGVEPTSTGVCVPRRRSNLVEIPVCVPDDLQLHDGLHLNAEGISQAWRQILRLTHRRGELFTLIFHLELASLCEESFVALIEEARRLRPPVWIARLREISDWWHDKATFRAEVSDTPEGLHISLVCSPRATVLARGLPTGGEGQVWGDGYHRVLAKSLDLPAVPRPFVGIAGNVPGSVVMFLREQGYILDPGESAARCGTYLDAAVLSNLASEVELLNYIEDSPRPLVRYWLWPDGAKSALCVTGDLDALSLLDYASRPLLR